MLNLFRRKQGQTFRDFIHGKDFRCVTCNKYAHRDNMSFPSYICDDCGINTQLHKRLDEAIKRKNEAEQMVQGNPTMDTTYNVYLWDATYNSGHELIFIGAQSTEQAKMIVDARCAINESVLKDVRLFVQIPNATTEKKGILRIC